MEQTFIARILIMDRLLDQHLHIRTLLLSRRQCGDIGKITGFFKQFGDQFMHRCIWYSFPESLQFCKETAQPLPQFLICFLFRHRIIRQYALIKGLLPGNRPYLCKVFSRKAADW